VRLSSTILCTSGLMAEAKIARRAGFAAVVGAGDYERTVQLVADAVPHAECLVSFGIAGALAPGLRAGDVILSQEVVGDDERWISAALPGSRLGELAEAIGAIEGPVWGATRIVATQADKARAWIDTGALAVDLESAVVARAATAAGIPFLVLRAIADPATRHLPPAALLPLARDGRPALSRITASVLRNPGQLRGLVGLAREARRALAALTEPANTLSRLLAAL
jgi:adenosylhomocysteine nucleosidase